MTKSMLMSYSKDRKSLYLILKNYYKKTEEIKHKLLYDFKILYPDYQQIKNLDYLISKIIT